jgi:hypothetical protein
MLARLSDLKLSQKIQLFSGPSSYTRATSIDFGLQLNLFERSLWRKQ